MNSFGLCSVISSLNSFLVCFSTFGTLRINLLGIVDRIRTFQMNSEKILELNNFLQKENKRLNYDINLLKEEVLNLKTRKKWKENPKEIPKLDLSTLNPVKNLESPSILSTRGPVPPPPRSPQRIISIFILFLFSCFLFILYFFFLSFPFFFLFSSSKQESNLNILFFLTDFL